MPSPSPPIYNSANKAATIEHHRTTSTLSPGQTADKPTKEGTLPARHYTGCMHEPLQPRSQPLSPYNPIRAGKCPQASYKRCSCCYQIFNSQKLSQYATKFQSLLNFAQTFVTMFPLMYRLFHPPHVATFLLFVLSLLITSFLIYCCHLQFGLGNWILRELGPRTFRTHKLRSEVSAHL